MTDQKNAASTSILIGCGVISGLLAVLLLVVKRDSAEFAESFGYLFFGAGYLLLGLSRKNSGTPERQGLFVNLASIFLVAGTLVVGYYTLGNLK